MSGGVFGLLLVSVENTRLLLIQMVLFDMVSVVIGQ